jgi:small subunit ribosomal protein S14
MTDSGTRNRVSRSNSNMDPKGERTGNQLVCRDTGREQGLIGKYDIWLCRQSFREMARDIGFRKYD